jgi:hypothetical protein
MIFVVFLYVAKSKLIAATTIVSGFHQDGIFKDH